MTDGNRKFDLRTTFVVVAYLAVMFSSFNFLPTFTRFHASYSTWVLAACWLLAGLGAFIPVVVKQSFLSNRFWYAWMAVTTIGTWSAFWLLRAWCENEARRSPQFPGLGALIFLVVAALVAGLIAFLVGWCVPKSQSS